MESPIGFCGCREEFGDGSPALKLQTNRPLIFIRDALPEHSRDEIWLWVEESLKRWGKVSNFSGRRIFDLSEAGSDDYVIMVTVADLGGDGTLADMQLPYTTGKVLVMRLNARIKWKRTDGPMAGGTIDPVRTITHELGHGMGMTHFSVSPPPELMEPRITHTIISPQPTEAKVAASWFGPPISTDPPTPPVPKYSITLTSDSPIKVA